MSAFTCITCRVAFNDAEVQRSHYKTDWHRYNLKRKVASLPPVTMDNFQQRVLAQRAQTADLEKDTTTTCSLCSKHFSTKNSFESHTKSKKHKDNEMKDVQKYIDTVKKENEKNQEKGLIKPQLEKDAVNMALKTSKSPQPSPVLGTGSREARSSGSAGTSGTANRATRRTPKMKVEDKNDSDESDTESWDSEDEDGLGIEECLFCSKVGASLEENVSHMTLKHSFFIPDAEYLVDLEGLITYLGQKVGCGNLCLWCNEKGKSFRDTKSVQKHMLDKGHCKVLHEGEALIEYTDFYDYTASYPDHETRLEGATGGEDVEMENLGDEDVHHEELSSDGFELVLPSGTTVGHRSLMRYYKQNLVPIKESRTKSILPKMLAQYRALGWTGAIGEAAVRKVKDLGYMQRMKLRHNMSLGIKANKMQHHFRIQIMF